MGLWKCFFEDFKVTKIQNGRQRSTPINFINFIFLRAQKLKNLPSENIPIYNHISHDMEMCRLFFKVLLKYEMAAMDENVQVIFLKFKMATTSRLF